MKEQKQQRAEYEKRISSATNQQRPGLLSNEAGVPFHTSNRMQFKVNPLRRFLSCELEVSGLSDAYVKLGVNPLDLDPRVITINEVLEYWHSQIVHDQSLPQRGFEINTAPANGDLFVKQINEICSELLKFGATCVNNYDTRKRQHPCGMHVHVDARDFSYHDLRRFLLFYEMVEPILYSMLPGERQNSHFAERCGKLLGHMVRLGEPIRGGSLKGKYDPAKVHLIEATYASEIPARGDKRACLQEARYRSLNTHAWFYRRTLEFRHMYGTLDAAEIIAWASIVGHIVEYAYVIPFSTIQSLARAPEANRSWDAFVACLGARPELLDFAEAQINKFKGTETQPESPLLETVPFALRTAMLEADAPPPRFREARRPRPRAERTQFFGNPWVVTTQIDTQSWGTTQPQQPWTVELAGAQLRDVPTDIVDEIVDE